MREQVGCPGPKLAQARGPVRGLPDHDVGNNTVGGLKVRLIALFQKGYPGAKQVLPAAQVFTAGVHFKPDTGVLVFPLLFLFQAHIDIRNDGGFGFAPVSLKRGCRRVRPEGIGR